MMDKNGNLIGVCVCVFKVVYLREEQIFSWKDEKVFVVCLSRTINVMTEFHYFVRQEFFKAIILSTEIYIQTCHIRFP